MQQPYSSFSVSLLQLAAVLFVTHRPEKRGERLLQYTVLHILCSWNPVLFSSILEIKFSNGYLLEIKVRLVFGWQAPSPMQI